MDFDPNDLDWGLLLAFNASGVLYGGLHLLAWNAEFSTDIQKGLWRLASLLIMIIMPASTIILLTENLMFMVIDAKKVGYRIMEALYEGLHRRGVMQVSFLLGLLAYLCARVYLVVECFISLLHSPVEVYNLPVWSAYVLHIT